MRMEVGRRELWRYQASLCSPGRSHMPGRLVPEGEVDLQYIGLEGIQRLTSKWLTGRDVSEFVVVDHQVIVGKRY